MTAEVRPGALITQHDERHLILAVRGDKCLVLHVSDGMSRTWLACSIFDGCEHEADPVQWMHQRRKKALVAAQDAVRTKGTDEALRCAERAGVYEALERVASALLYEE